MPDETELVKAIYAAWVARDLDTTVGFIDDDMTFALHIPAEVVPGGGEISGKANVAAALQGILDTYDFLSYVPSGIEQMAGSVRAVVTYRYRHKASGEEVENSMRHLWQFAGNKARRLDEWHEIEPLRAFAGRVADKGAG